MHLCMHEIQMEGVRLVEEVAKQTGENVTLFKREKKKKESSHPESQTWVVAGWSYPLSHALFLCQESQRFLAS